MSDYIVGLTGGIGSGKTTVANIFADLDVAIIDADIIARDVLAQGTPALAAIVKHFGSQYILDDGQLNRALLRQTIFSNEDDKLWLNNLLHPLIREQLVLQTKAATSPYCLLVAPLLVENNLLKLVDRVLVVDVSEATQIARTIQRDNNDETQVQAIINSQVSRKERIELADDIINNENCSLALLQKSVLALHQKYLIHTKSADFNSDKK